MLKPLLAAACLCATVIAEAERPGLSGQEISELVAGATIEIETPLGTRLPIRYARDGHLSGQARDLAPYLGAATDTGRWWVASDQLCHKWKRWLNSEPQCFRMRKEGRTIRWWNQDGNSGTAAITVPAPVQIAAAAPATAQPDVVPAAAPALPLAPPKPVPAQRPAATASAATPRPQDAPKQADTGSAPADLTMAQAPTAPAGNLPSASVAGGPRRPVQAALMVVNVARDDVLNVRSGPSAEFEVVGALHPGSRGVTVTGACQARWCPVEHATARGWVNSAYLGPEERLSALPARPAGEASVLRDNAGAPRSCLTPAAHALLDRIEAKFGPVEVVSTCRSGATIAGTGWLSRHASGNAVDFKAGSRKAEIVEWLIANHHDGGTMTYGNMDHIHVDIGRHFVSLASGRSWGWPSN
ncbi:MAG TPA: SH3 domain-containing protein [Hyphomicrobiaceae bacterium]